MKKLIVANWKMNPSSLKEAKEIFKKINNTAARLKRVETVVCPPYVYLPMVNNASSKIMLGAQDVSCFENGAHTGDISASMLKNMGAKYVIIGHSERRYPKVGLGETDELINKKIKISLKNGLKIVFCIGEKTRDDDGKYLGIIKTQMDEGLRGISKKDFRNIIFAYEPIWAIGIEAKSSDTPEATSRVAIFIKRMLSHFLGNDEAKKTMILYGGSVNVKNAEPFLKNGGVNGLLVGRESLNPENFIKILKTAEDI